MTDEPEVKKLENRIDKLESTIEKMMPSRRDALKMGGAALVGGAAMSGTASAGTSQVGTIGDKDATPPQLVDLHSEDINNADTVTTQDLDATNITASNLNSDRITNHYLYAGNFSGSGASARLQNAISAASPGQLIYLEQAPYFNDVNVNKRLHLQGPTAASRSDGAVFRECVLRLTKRTVLKNVGFFTLGGSGSIEVEANCLLSGIVTNFEPVNLVDGESSITGSKGLEVTIESGVTNCVITGNVNTNVTDNSGNNTNVIANNS